MRVGSELKAARKKAGITVDVIAKHTKFKANTLVALEKGEFKKLPTGLYLFSMVRAYAHEVHIDPEPLVERLRAEFADQDALDALQALDARGALEGKSAANVGRTPGQTSTHLRTAMVAAGVVLIAGVGVGAGAYFSRANGTVREVRSSLNETGSVPLASPTPAPKATAAVNIGQQAGAPIRTPASTKTRKPRAVVVAQTPEETAESADQPAHIDEPMPERPVIAAAP
jgi:cytoskeletal protein RodZ